MIEFTGALMAACLLLCICALVLAISCYKSQLKAITKNDLLDMEVKMATKVNELLDKFTQIEAQLEKARVEIVAHVAELAAALEDVELTPEAEAKLVALQAKAQELDDLNADPS